jgi:hypothetical protein
MLHTHVASKNEDMNEMIDVNAYEMKYNYGSQTPKVLHILTSFFTIKTVKLVV